MVWVGEVDGDFPAIARAHKVQIACKYGCGTRLGFKCTDGCVVYLFDIYVRGTDCRIWNIGAGSVEFDAVDAGSIHVFQLVSRNDKLTPWVFIEVINIRWNIQAGAGSFIHSQLLVVMRRYIELNIVACLISELDALILIQVVQIWNRCVITIGKAEVAACGSGLKERPWIYTRIRVIKTNQQVAYAVILKRGVKGDGYPARPRARESAFKHFVALTDRHHVRGSDKHFLVRSLQEYLKVVERKRTVGSVVKTDGSDGSLHSDFVMGVDLLGKGIIANSIQWMLPREIGRFPIPDVHVNSPRHAKTGKAEEHH